MSTDPQDLPRQLARRIAATAPAADARALPAARQRLLALAGACVAARRQAPVMAALLAIDQPGPCTVFGHVHTLGVEGAAFVNSVAAEGEIGCAVLPALLAAAQRHGAGGDDLLRGIAIGLELDIRLRALPGPASGAGVLAVAAAVGTMLELTEGQLASALAMAGGLASAAEGAGPGMPHLHDPWAAQAGYRAVRLAMSAFGGFGGFVAAPAAFTGLDGLLPGLGEDWQWLAPRDEAPADFHARCTQGELVAAQAQGLAAAIAGLFSRPLIDTDSLSY